MGEVFICSTQRISHGERISFYQKQITGSTQHEGLVGDVRARATFDNRVLCLEKEDVTT